MAIAKRKKRFFEIDIPLIKKKTQLQAFEAKELNNRFLKFDLTRSLKGKSMLLTVQLKVEDENAKTFPKEIKVMPFYLKRLVRKGTSYVEDSFSTETKDSQIRIKPFLVTRRKVPRNLRKALREKAREELVKSTASKSAENIFEEVLKNKLQKELSLKLKKVYPLSTCEIRVLKVVNFKE